MLYSRPFKIVILSYSGLCELGEEKCGFFFFFLILEEKDNKYISQQWDVCKNMM